MRKGRVDDTQLLPMPRSCLAVPSSQCPTSESRFSVRHTASPRIADAVRDLAEVGVYEVDDAEGAAQVEEERERLAPEEVRRGQVFRGARQGYAQPALQGSADARRAGEPEELRGEGRF